MSTALAQLNLTSVAAQLPACSVRPRSSIFMWLLAADAFQISCSEQILPTGGCPLEDAPNCLCSNVTMQAQLSTCVQMSCNKTEQLCTHLVTANLGTIYSADTVSTVSSSISQDIICKGVPYPSRSEEISRAIIILSAFAFPVIILRIIARRIVSEIWWDDWAIIGAGVSIFLLISQMEAKM